MQYFQSIVRLRVVALHLLVEIAERVVHLNARLFEIHRAAKDLLVALEMLGCLVVNKDFGGPGLRASQFLGSNSK